MNDADILVIEDDKTIQNFIRITLKTKGYPVSYTHLTLPTIA